MTFWHLWVGKDPYKSNQQFEFTATIWLDITFERPETGKALYWDHKEERSGDITNNKNNNKNRQKKKEIELKLLKGFFTIDDRAG